MIVARQSLQAPPVPEVVVHLGASRSPHHLAPTLSREVSLHGGLRPAEATVCSSYPLPPTRFLEERVEQGCLRPVVRDRLLSCLASAENNLEGIHRAPSFPYEDLPGFPPRPPPSFSPSSPLAFHTVLVSKFHLEEAARNCRLFRAACLPGGIFSPFFSSGRDESHCRSCLANRATRKHKRETDKAASFKGDNRCGRLEGRPKVRAPGTLPRVTRPLEGAGRKARPEMGRGSAVA